MASETAARRLRTKKVGQTAFLIILLLLVGGIILGFCTSSTSNGVFYGVQPDLTNSFAIGKALYATTHGYPRTTGAFVTKLERLTKSTKILPSGAPIPSATAGKNVIEVHVKNRNVVFYVALDAQGQCFGLSDNESMHGPPNMGERFWWSSSQSTCMATRVSTFKDTGPSWSAIGEGLH